MKKRVLALLMSLCIVIGLLPCVALAEDDESAWSGSVDTSWYDDSSTTYTISTAAELAGLASLVNDGNSFSDVTINLGANIDLGSKAWTPIGDDDGTNKFSGTFDGNDCSITGLTNQLFAAVDGATIQNLTVEANIVLTEEADCAAVVNQSYGDTTLENVTVNGHVEAQAGAAAGLVRKVESGTFVMKNCTNNAEIIGKDRKAAGMIVTTSSGNILMENCVNTGSVSASQTEKVSKKPEVYAGGMIAWCQGTVTLQNCKNTGAISGVRTVGDPAGNDATVACGGLVAVAWYDGTNVTITDCENSGEVTSENRVTAHNAHAGGIVGMCNPKAVVAIYDTVSSGDVTGRCTDTSNTSGVANVGGVVGQLNNSTVTIYNIEISEGVNISGSSNSTSKNNVGLAVGNRCVGNYAGTLNIGNVIVIDESELPMVGSSANDYTKVVAAIGSNVYTDFSSAINAASDDETVVLLDDIELDAAQKITKSVTIDLNGHDIKGTSTRVFHVQSGTLSLTGEGTVYSTHADNDVFENRSSVIRVGNDSDDSSTSTAAGLEIGADVTVSTDWCYGVSVFGSSTTETVDVYGTISVTGEASALSGNGLKQYAGTTINIYEGAFVTSEKNVAIYHPQSGTLTITGGAISGTSGIEAKAGTVNISGDAKITATGTGLSTSGNKNGTSSSGYAVVMLNNSAYAGEPIATISGGYFIGTVAAADDDEESSDEEGSAKITVSGGHFSKSVDPKYLDTSLNAELVSSDSGNKTPYSYYTDVEAAQEAASAGDTINDLSSTVSEGENAYTIVLDYNDGKSAKVVYTVSASNGSIILPSPTRSGYTLSSWSDGTSTYAGGKTYTVPEDMESGVTITLTAQWSYNGGGGGGTVTYSITVPSVSNGTVTASRTSASKGTTVTLTVSLDDGYELSSLTVTDANGNVLPLTDKGDGKYVFTMPASKVTVFATFKAATHDCPSEKFTDVDISQYYHEAVDWAVTNGVTVGTSATNFSPNASCTRAQMVTFLWRAAGSPAPATWVNPFTDVESGAYYYDAVLWAVEKGITVGTSATTFSPDATVTRGQTVTFLYRCAGSPAVSGSNSFVDVDSNAYYANAVQWAVTNEVTYGTSTTTFSPENDCTRAQIVTLLYRYIVE